MAGGKIFLLFLLNNKDAHENTSMINLNRMNPNDKDLNSSEPWKFFRVFLWYSYSNIYNWKSLAYSIYHIEYLINHLDNYLIKDVIEKPFRNILDYFTLFMKDLITIQIQSSKRNEASLSSTPQTTSSEINQIEQHLEKLKTDFTHLKDLILTTKERFNLCKTDINAIEILVQAMETINFDRKIFDQQDQEKIRLLSCKQDLSEKSNKTDLIQMKIYIDNQLKKLIELNKENAQELERIKLLKTSTCQARQIQSILSTNPPSLSKQSHRIYSHQSSRPYITFELDHIRQYQRQALIKSPYGTIPLYRRQAWAAANLFPNHSLHFLRYMQNSLRMQVHDLLGYDPSDICNTNRKKKIKKNSTMNIFHHRTNDVLIMGNNNRLYRGRIDSCEIIPSKKIEENKLKIKTKIEEKNTVHFDQFDQSNQRIFDEHLFEYLDWQNQFNEQDLPDELCAELFQHWTSIVCNEQSCQCNSESIEIPSESSSVNDIYDDRCMCSECSCSCEKYQDDQSICLCSQCSCKCLKDSPDQHEDTIEDRTEIYQKTSENEVYDQPELEILPRDPTPIVQNTEENEIVLCDCFLNRTDQWTEQFDFSPTARNLSQTSKENDIHTIFNSLELDDPTIFRREILNNHSSI